jgi:hypothetical protein
MTRILIACFACLFSIGCASSKQQEESSAVKQDTAKALTPERIYTFGYTASGIGNIPSDGIRLDSSRQMTIVTRTRLSSDKFHEVTGIAYLEDPEFNRLIEIMERGKLTKTDPSDVGVKCSQGAGELITLVLRASDEPRAVTLNFDDCATEFNLLLEPQRTAFAELVQWFRDVRAKYRPADPTIKLPRG